MILYKYVPPERVDILTNQEIAFPPPSIFNDPFEMVPRFDTTVPTELLEEMLTDEMERASAAGEIESRVDNQLGPILPLLQEKYPALNVDELTNYLRDFSVRWVKENLPAVSELYSTMGGQDGLAAFGEQTQQRIDALCGVFSLSGVGSNILMWSHYARSHTGLVIAFKSEHPFFDRRRNADDPIRRIKPVQYHRVRPSHRGLDFRSADIAVELVDHMLFSKAIDWAYEEEWRMIMATEDADRFLDAGGKRLPLFNVPSDAFHSVTIGMRASKDLEDLVVETVRKDLSHVDVRRAVLDRDEYAIVLADL